jgi:hypothetical protein
MNVWEQWPPIEGNQTGNGSFLVFVLMVVTILCPIVLLFIVKG